MVTPVRIQRRRVIGYDMQAVSRATNGLTCISVTRPGRWGNPYDVKVFGRELSMALFRNSVEGVWNPALMDEHSDELLDEVRYWLPEGMAFSTPDKKPVKAKKKAA
jgi:hypothetical protein